MQLEYPVVVSIFFFLLFILSLPKMLWSTRARFNRVEELISWNREVVCRLSRKHEPVALDNSRNISISNNDGSRIDFFTLGPPYRAEQ